MAVTILKLCVFRDLTNTEIHVDNESQVSPCLREVTDKTRMKVGTNSQYEHMSL